MSRTSPPTLDLATASNFRGSSRSMRGLAPQSGTPEPSAAEPRRVQIDDLVVDLDGYEVRRRGVKIPFTHQEFELLSFFVQNRGRVFTRRELIQRVWSGRQLGSLRTVDIHVYRLRSKLGPPFDGLIATVLRVGYKLCAEPPSPAAPRPVLV